MMQVVSEALWWGTGFINLGPTEILLLLILALILLGPSKLPELARSLGQAINEFKKATSGAFGSEPTLTVQEVQRARREKTIRDLARELGIDTAGKTDEELEREIIAMVKKEGGPSE